MKSRLTFLVIALMASISVSVAQADDLVEKLTVKERIDSGTTIEFVSSSGNLLVIRTISAGGRATREFVSIGAGFADRFTSIKDSLKVEGDNKTIEVKDNNTGMTHKLVEREPLRIPSISIVFTSMGKEGSNLLVQANGHFRLAEDGSIDTDVSKSDGQWYKLIKIGETEVLISPCDKVGKLKDAAVKISVK